MYVVLFFQAEDGIRDIGVTGVQTCALPICLRRCLGPCGGCRTREGTVPAGTVPSGSPAQAEPLDERPVPADVGLGQVVEQPATTTDQQEQPPPAVGVVLVLLEVLCQVAAPAV